VAKGFTQVIGEDYKKTYASVARLESVCLVCAIATSQGLYLWQIDLYQHFSIATILTRYLWNSQEDLKKKEKILCGDFERHCMV